MDNQPICVFLGRIEVTSSKEHGDGHRQGHGKRHWMVHTRNVVNGLACAFQGLSRMAL